MDKNQLHFFSKELKKEASGIMEFLSNLDPTSVAAAMTMAKINLANRYGDKIPILKDVMGAHYKGMMHSGLMTGLRGEKGTSEATRFLTGMVDSNTPGVYEKAKMIGENLRKAGVTPETLPQKKEELKALLAKVPYESIRLDEKSLDSILSPKQGLNSIYDALGSPVFKKKKKPEITVLKKAPQGAIDIDAT